ncbi:hypothetical protein BC941DRAFT_381048 [Chlamydoabsidia padenii]|nr:hypothetical protein BC941DRAFT_381048 [Chlamydoabsidia padenii]
MHLHKLGNEWMDYCIDHELVSLLSDEVYKIVSPTGSSTCPASTWTRRTRDKAALPTLQLFIEQLVRRSHTRTGTLLVALILLTRLSCRLGHVTQGMASAPHRIFLASLIISTKLVHDTSPKNKHWLAFSNHHFELAEINLMEKQFLTLMDFHLSLSQYDFQQVVDRYRQFHQVGRIKKRRWQDTRDYLISSAGRNVALAPTSKDAIDTKKPLPVLSPTLSTPSTPSSSPSSSTLSESSLLVQSLSCTPRLTSTTLQSSTLASIPSNDSDRLYSMIYLSPLSPV